jgi:TetR/AcrR family transcriptional repressor of mexJK operon
VPKRSKAEDIRIAAQRLFLRSGLRQTSMDAIAAEANVSKQTLYRYYQGKDQLFAEVLGSMTYDRLRAGITELMPAGPVSRAQLETTLEAISLQIIDFLLAPSYVALLRVVIAEVRDFPELARLFRSSVAERGAAALAGVLTSPDVQAVVAVEQLEPTLRLLAGPLLSYLLEALLGDAASAKKRARTEIPILVRLFVGAISTDQTTCVPSAPAADAVSP